MKNSTLHALVKRDVREHDAALTTHTYHTTGHTHIDTLISMTQRISIPFNCIEILWPSQQLREEKASPSSLLSKQSWPRFSLIALRTTGGRKKNKPYVCVCVHIHTPFVGHTNNRQLPETHPPSDQRTGGQPSLRAKWCVPAREKLFFTPIGECIAGPVAQHHKTRECLDEKKNRR